MGHGVKVLTYGADETDDLIPSGNLLYKNMNMILYRSFLFRDRKVSAEISFHIFNKNIEKDIKKIIEMEHLMMLILSMLYIH